MKNWSELCEQALNLHRNEDLMKYLDRCLWTQ